MIICCKTSDKKKRINSYNLYCWAEKRKTMTWTYECTRTVSNWCQTNRFPVSYIVVELSSIPVQIWNGRVARKRYSIGKVQNTHETVVIEKCGEQEVADWEM